MWHACHSLCLSRPGFVSSCTHAGELLRCQWREEHRSPDSPPTPADIGALISKVEFWVYSIIAVKGLRAYTSRQCSDPYVMCGAVQATVAARFRLPFATFSSSCD